MAREKITNCKDCEFCSIIPSLPNQPLNKWRDVKCNHELIDTCTVKGYVDEDEKVPVPSWCPMKYSDDYYKHKTITEIREYISKIKPLVKWEDIKVGEIYHIPPIGNQKRTDIFIISHSEYMIRFKELTDIETGTGYERTMYKVSFDDWRVMAPYCSLDLTKLKEKLQKDIKKHDVNSSFWR